MCPTEGIFYYQKFIKTYSFCFFPKGSFFCYAFNRKGGDFLTIEEYIKSKPKFELMPFVTVYTTIMELINDGFIDHNAFKKGGGAGVAVSQPKPKAKVRRGLYRQSDFESDI